MSLKIKRAAQYFDEEEFEILEKQLAARTNELHEALATIDELRAQVDDEKNLSIEDSERRSKVQKDEIDRARQTVLLTAWKEFESDLEDLKIVVDEIISGVRGTGGLERFWGRFHKQLRRAFRSILHEEEFELRD